MEGVVAPKEASWGPLQGQPAPVEQDNMWSEASRSQPAPVEQDNMWSETEQTQAHLVNGKIPVFQPRKRCLVNGPPHKKPPQDPFSKQTTV